MVPAAAASAAVAAYHQDSATAGADSLAASGEACLCCLHLELV